MVTLGFLQHKKETGKVEGFPGTKSISNEDLLKLECDVLLPSAFENQITGEIAKDVKAKPVILANRECNSSSF